ncbi:hypothetical protein [Nocardioides marmoribigeumensis]|uniref:Uncharacterized protein n=1 Tax=Nocardioides marmoribigeumensis TaxID=433649 RepID=A0ABU2BTD8_9ACTN|nr:hypothetical protein [Nocardioides marmoribigeumensis]MDR7361887.1 hypothetical protein [Nocardioides marmoribigeumensis]
MGMRRWWQGWSVALAVSAVLVSILLHLVPVLLFVTAVMVFLGGLIAWTVADGLGRNARHACEQGLLWGGVGGAAAAGWVPLLHWWGVLLVLTAVLTQPDLVSGVRGMARRRLAPPVPPERMPDAELRHRWQETTSRVRRTTTVSSPVDVARMVELLEERARILDEVESRDPAGFDRWINDEAGWDHSR